MNMRNTWLSPERAFDILMRARYLYYVECMPEWSDLEYDQKERDAFGRWPQMGQAVGVGSGNVEGYSAYIREGRRPGALERGRRDALLLRATLGDLW